MPALQARSSATDAATGTPPAPTRPAPAADPIPLRSRWVPRLRLAEHPLALTLLVVLAALAVAQLLTPAPARADVPIVGPIVSGITGLVGGVANDIFVKGFGALLQFIFGKALTDLAQEFPQGPARRHPTLRAERARRPRPAAQRDRRRRLGTADAQLHRRRARLLALQLHLQRRAAGRHRVRPHRRRDRPADQQPVHLLRRHRSGQPAHRRHHHHPSRLRRHDDRCSRHLSWQALLTQGGVGMIAVLIAAVMALALILVKITITALLAVLYVLSPLAIGLWPVEQLSWLLRTLLQVAFVALIFPVLWAACFAVFAVLAPKLQGSLGALYAAGRRCGVDHRVQAAVRAVADLHRRRVDPVGRQGDERDLSRPRPGASVMSTTAPATSNEPYRHLEDREEILLGPAFPPARVRAARRSGRDRVRPVRLAAAGAVQLGDRDHHRRAARRLVARGVQRRACAVDGHVRAVALVALPEAVHPGANPVPGYHITEAQEPQPSPRAGGGAPALAQLEELL